MVICNPKFAVTRLLGTLFPIAAASSLVHAESGRDRWAHPIPVPASAASSPSLRQALQRWNRKQLREARECGRGLQELRPELKFRKDANLPYSNQYRVMFDSSMLYSVAVTTDLFCGGPYPVTDNKIITWNVNNGHVFDPLTLYKIGKRNKTRSISVLPEVRQMIKKI